jgi:hypothetical protein
MLKPHYLAIVVALSLVGKAAEAAELKTDTIVCMSQSRIDEMAKAFERGDGDWAESIGGCFLTKMPAKYQRIDCSWTTCKVRIWPQSGSTESAIAYVLRTQLR